MIGSQRHNHMSYFDGESRFIFRGGLALLCRPGLPQNSVDQEDTMKSHRVAGGGGAELNVVECGNPQGRAIWFLHGASQCSLQWSRQMDSGLVGNNRLIAMDLRGHGRSAKPRDAYNDSKLWADDVHAVMETLDLDHAVLCGWSYGPLVFLDYIRHYGEDRIGGLHFIGAVTKLGSEDAMSVLTPELLGIFGDFLATDAEASMRGSK